MQGKIDIVDVKRAEGLIRARGCEIRVRFWESILPPGLMTGMTVTVVGRMSTVNLGQDFMLRDCLIIENAGGFRRSLGKTIKKYCLPPSTYMSLPIMFLKGSKK